MGSAAQLLLVMWWTRQDPRRLVQVIRFWVEMFGAVGERYIILQAGLVDLSTASKFPVYVTPDDYVRGLERYVEKMMSHDDRPG